MRLGSSSFFSTASLFFVFAKGQNSSSFGGSFDGCDETAIRNACLHGNPSSCYTASCTQSCQKLIPWLAECCAYGDFTDLHNCFRRKYYMAVTSAELVYSLEPVCTDYYQSLVSCAVQTSNFLYLQPSRKASCLCYNSQGAWDPEAYDGHYSECIVFLTGYLKTLPLATLTSLEGVASIFEASLSLSVPTVPLDGLGLSPCATLGNVRQATVTASAASSPSAAPSATAKVSMPSQTVSPGFATFSTTSSSTNAAITPAAMHWKDTAAFVCYLVNLGVALNAL